MSSTLDSTVNAPIANRGTRMDHLDWLEAESIHLQPGKPQMVAVMEAGRRYIVWKSPVPHSPW